ncbi:MAG: cadherin-like domain-containing protein [Saprospiraceae bacterium]
MDNLSVSFRPDAINTSSSLENTCNVSETGEDTPGPPYAISGVYQPLGNMNPLIGSSSFGVWTLALNDNEPADGGILEDWSITVCYEVPSNPPVLVNNLLLQVPRGDQRTITQTYLLTEDATSSPTQLVYTLETLPSEGTLRLNGSPLLAGHTFTQANINNGQLVYQHNGGIILSDDFAFTVTNNDGVSITGNLFQIQITVMPMQVTTVQTGTIGCHGGSNAAISVTVSGGLPPYDYALNGGSYQASNQFSGLAAGSYVVTVRDALDDVVSSSSFQISEPTAVSGMAQVNNNQITVTPSGGTPPYTYQLNGGTPQSSNTFSSLPNGTYILTIIDNNGCTGSTQATVLVNTLNVSAAIAQQITCHDSNNGIIVVLANGGSAPYVYSLNGGAYQSNNTFTNLASGVYTITVRDNDGFTRTTSPYTVVNPPALTGSAMVNTNTITVAAMGGTGTLSYRLNGGTPQSSPVFSGLANGNYTITVTDTNGCTLMLNATVAVNTLAVNTSLVQGITCHDANDAILAANASGGTPPLQYSLNGGAYQSNNTFTNLAPGVYTITVRDNDGFTRTTSPYTVVNPPALTGSAMVNTNTITVAAMGGTGTLSYRLNGGTPQSSPVFSGLANGNYTITVTDTNGCTLMLNATVAVNSLVVSASIVEAISCHGVHDAVIMATVSGGTAPYSYSLDGLVWQDSPIFTNL